MSEYRDIVDYILKIPLFAKKIGLDNLAGLLRRLGNPQDKAKVIHVAGTNGKGSTCKALAVLLMKAGYRVGLFTSPHLISINERIRVNDEMISNDDFVDCFLKVKACFEDHPSFFEVIFAMAAVYFSEKKVDYVIYETGMGGRLDATNLVKPSVTVITSIGLDHTEYLGDTIEKIAYEKAGIIKQKIPVVYFRRDDASARVIETTAEKMRAPVASVEKSQYIINEIGDKVIDFSLHNRYYSYDHLKIKKTSIYQVENACLAIVAFAILMKQTGRTIGYIPFREKAKEENRDILQQTIMDGLKDFCWEGRMEEIAEGIYVDGAHNVEAIDSYCRTLFTLHRNKSKILVFAAVKDKDYESMILKLVHQISFREIIVTSVENDRKAPVNSIADTFRSYTDTKVHVCPDVQDAMNCAVALRNRYQKDAEMRHSDDSMGIYCVGSLYLVGAVKKWMLDNRR